MEKKFDVLYENLLERFQQGGFLIGDRVRFKKNVLAMEFFKSKGQNFIDIVKSCTDPGFDLNLRVSAIKSIYPTTTQNYRGGTESPDKIFADVIIEYAPGLYRTPMTVPIESLELQDDGINTGPVPDSVKRKSKIDIKPQSVKAEQNTKHDINLQNVNVKLPSNSIKHDFSQPYTGWQPLPTR